MANPIPYWPEIQASSLKQEESLQWNKTENVHKEKGARYLKREGALSRHIKKQNQWTYGFDAIIFQHVLIWDCRDNMPHFLVNPSISDACQIKFSTKFF